MRMPAAIRQRGWARRAALSLLAASAWALGATGCYQRVVDTKGWRSGEVSEYEPNVREDGLLERLLYGDHSDEDASIYRVDEPGY